MVLIPNPAESARRRSSNRRGWGMDGWMVDESEIIDTPLPHFEAMSFMNRIFVWRPFSFVRRRKGLRQGVRQGGEE